MQANRPEIQETSKQAKDTKGTPGHLFCFNEIRIFCIDTEWCLSDQCTHYPIVSPGYTGATEFRTHRGTVACSLTKPEFPSLSSKFILLFFPFTTNLWPLLFFFFLTRGRKARFHEPQDKCSYYVINDSLTDLNQSGHTAARSKVFWFVQGNYRLTHHAPNPFLECLTVPRPEISKSNSLASTHGNIHTTECTWQHSCGATVLWAFRQAGVTQLSDTDLTFHSERDQSQWNANDRMWAKETFRIWKQT